MAVVELNRVGPESAAVPLRRIREALHRLRAVESTLQMLDRVTAEVCRSCGFDRCVFFRLDGASLTPEGAHFVGDPHWQDDWLDSARSHPVVLDARDPEINLLRRQVAVLAIDARESAHGVRDILDGAGMTAYVAAPVTVRGNVIGTLHADRYFGGRGVDVVARDVLAVFAEGFSWALERTLLLERMRLQSRRVRALLATAAETTIEEIGDAGVEFPPRAAGPSTMPHHPAATSLPTDSRLADLLTPRELEVVELIARGATNADISAQLLIAESTAKEHVKRVLRKLHVKNRAQAVSCYMRLRALPRAA